MSIPIDEIDGPPRAYLEVSDECNHQSYRDGRVITRLRYRTIAIRASTERAVLDWMEAAIGEIRVWCDANDAFIIWRARPRIERLDAATWITRARLVTSHPLPPDMWERFEVKEGAIIPILDPTVRMNPRTRESQHLESSIVETSSSPSPSGCECNGVCDGACVR